VDINPDRMTHGTLRTFRLRTRPGSYHQKNQRDQFILQKRFENQIKENDIIFVSVNTPTKTYGQGAEMAADLQYCEKTARQILKTFPVVENRHRKKHAAVKTALPWKKFCLPAKAMLNLKFFPIRNSWRKAAQ
jgi:UDPglucose 6-dehydrogenase